MYNLMATIVLDALGGDIGLEINIEGTIDAIKRYKDINVILVGPEEKITELFNKYKFSNTRVKIENATEVIGMEESPTNAVRHKKDSSIIKGMNLIAENKADAFVSAGNSGAIIASAMISLHNLPNILRPAIVTFLPTLTGYCVMLDVGGNVDCKPKNLLQFAIMGSIYVKEIFGIEQPKVGLLSIGKEETKGNELVLETHKLLRKSKLNFIGNIEGGDITLGIADVVICDGFIGNIILKFAEGVGEMLFKLIKQELKQHPIMFMSIPFLWSALKDLRKRIDYTEYGGAPLLGVNGVCLVCHGKSNSKAISKAIYTANEFVNKNINKKISEEMEKIIE
jgi:glycerol-3-phosphate acyltransferase PlsX